MIKFWCHQEQSRTCICFAVKRVAIEMNNFRVWGCEKLRVSEMSSHNYSNSDTTWMEQFQDNIKPHLHLTSIMCCIHQDLIRLWIFGKDLLIFYFFTATMVMIMLILSICFSIRKKKKYIYIYIYIYVCMYLYIKPFLLIYQLKFYIFLSFFLYMKIKIDKCDPGAQNQS